MQQAYRLKWKKEKHNCFHPNQVAAGNRLLLMGMGFAILLFAAGCGLFRKTKSMEVKSFDKEGHRGCRGLMPENTLPAFIKAVNLGVTTLEMDVVITRDSQAVVSHDPFFNALITTKPDGSYVTQAEEKSLRIYGMTYQEVSRYDVGLKPHPLFPQQQKIRAVKPLLAAVIDSVERYIAQQHRQPVQYNIETKCTPTTDGSFHPAPPQFVELLLQVIREKGIQDRVIIQSFDVRSLQYLHTHYPAVRTSLLVEGGEPFAQQLKQLGFIPSVYSPLHVLVTPLLVKQCRDAGIQLIPWTVNDVARIRELKQLGVDGVISDYPNLFNELK